MSAKRFFIAASAALLAALSVMPSASRAAGASPSQLGRSGAKPISPAQKQTTSGNLSLHSSQSTGAVTPTPTVYLVFWGSQWSKDPAGAASALQGLFGNLYGTADTWGTILDQYCEGLPVGTVFCGTSGIHVQHPTKTPLAGVWFDNASAEPSKTTTGQIAAEAVAAAAHFGNTTQTPNLNAQYVIASPSGTHPDNFPHGGFCAWHSSTSSSYGNIAYTNLPYVPDLGTGACTTLTPARLIDGYESTETHEYAETVTDPFPSNGWLKGGSEIGDLCVNQDAYLTINKQTFDVQGLWSNLAGGCVTQG